MRKYRSIRVDQDGVLAEYQKRFLEIWRELYPDRPWVDPETFTEHDTRNHYPREYEKDIESIELSSGFYRSLRPIEGGKEALEYMLQAGYDVRIVTAPKKKFRNCVLEKYEWIAEHLGQKWVERTILTRDKTLVTGDILIDDKPSVTGVAAPTWEHVLYDQPWNRGETKRRLTWATYKEVLEL
jgi:5'-nucleotidase